MQEIGRPNEVVAECRNDAALAALCDGTAGTGRATDGSSWCIGSAFAQHAPPPRIRQRAPLRLRRACSRQISASCNS
ncbi:hypothetical protein SF83666_c20590 [Sinorhizobium fredii CCBAU 83666]|nr:hypothetical protein SF83666_c20590 [Sinorhizobium fredii CCBAU 83666]